MLTTGISRTIARWRNPFRREPAGGTNGDAPAVLPEAQEAAPSSPASVEIAPDDPLLAYFQQNASVTELDRI
ncbi:MAG: hypothetical protein U0X20_31835, partial [Caldilineaceae bacterium]